MSELSGPFSGDIKTPPGPKAGANEWDKASSLNCSEGSLSTPFQEGVFKYHDGNQLLGVTTEVDLPHGSPTVDSPFHGDFRPGVDSSRKS